jgi:hypothetical protein
VSITGWAAVVPVLPMPLAAAGFKILTSDFRGRLYGAYTCIKP